MVFLLGCITLSGDVSGQPQDQGRDVIEFCFAMECPLWGTGKFVIDSVAACGRSIEHARKGDATSSRESRDKPQNQKTLLPQTGSVDESAFIGASRCALNGKPMYPPKALKAFKPGARI
jgi:hypothetical protein